MSRVVSCQQCAAPYRPARGQSRFTCEWCGTENAHTISVQTEELVVEGPCNPTIAVARATQVLQRRGVSMTRVNATPARWVPVWQVLSERGDEFVRCGRADASRLEASLRLPAARFVSASVAGSTRTLPPLPTPDIQAEQITAAARATYDDAEAPLRAVRLFWIPVCDVTAEAADFRAQGLYLGGSDEVIFEPLPACASDPPWRPGHLWGFAGFTALALLVGLLVRDPLDRAYALAAWWGVGLAVWGSFAIAKRKRAA